MVFLSLKHFYVLISLTFCDGEKSDGISDKTMIPVCSSVALKEDKMHQYVS